MESRRLLDGETITLGGVDYVAPPLNFRALEAMAPFIEERIASGSMQMRDIGKIREIIGLALKRNYPDLPDDVLLDHLDMGNAPTILAKILIASGARRSEPGEQKAPALAAGQQTTGAEPMSIS